MAEGFLESGQSLPSGPFPVSPLKCAACAAQLGASSLAASSSCSKLPGAMSPQADEVNGPRLAFSSSCSESMRHCCEGLRALVWDPLAVVALRCRHRLIGCAVGGVPGSAQQNRWHGPPVVLAPWEVGLGVELGVLRWGQDQNGKSKREEAREEMQEMGSSGCCGCCCCDLSSGKSSCGLSASAEARARVFRDLW
eukprot:RCo047868